jgi:hypothetical protein
MKKHLPFVLALIALILGEAKSASASSIITNTSISKSAWYFQNGSNPSNLVLDPNQPYSVTASAECVQNLSTSIVSATLTLPSGTTPIFKALSMGDNTGGVIYTPYFLSTNDMNTFCPAGSNGVFSINISGKTNYFTNVIGTDVFPPPPLILAVSNAVWTPQGYIMVQNPNIAFTISWPGTNGLQSGLTIYSIGNFNGFSTNNTPNATQFTFSTNLINQLPTGVVIPVKFNEWTTQGNFNSFAIFIPPSLFGSNPCTLFKQRSYEQTNASGLKEYNPQVAQKSDCYNIGNYGPYSFQVISPLPASFTTPAGTSIPLQVSSGGYSYCGGALTKLQLDSKFPSGTYTFATGQKLSLPSDCYPTAPQITSVNGKAPIWTNGMLQLTVNSSNNIVWSDFSGYAPFTQCGLEGVSFGSTDYTDWGNLSSDSGGGTTNFIICPAAGIGGNSLVTNLALPPNFLKTNVNYTMTVEYGALTGITNQPFLSGSGYTTKTIITIIAK